MEARSKLDTFSDQVDKRELAGSEWSHTKIESWNELKHRRNWQSNKLRKYNITNMKKKLKRRDTKIQDQDKRITYLTEEQEELSKQLKEVNKNLALVKQKKRKLERLASFHRTKSTGRARATAISVRVWQNWREGWRIVQENSSAEHRKPTSARNA